MKTMDYIFFSIMPSPFIMDFFFIIFFFFIILFCEFIIPPLSVDAAPVKRAISSAPVVKPIKITAPNSVFALGNSFK